MPEKMGAKKSSMVPEKAKRPTRQQRGKASDEKPFMLRGVKKQNVVDDAGRSAPTRHPPKMAKSKIVRRTSN